MEALVWLRNLNLNRMSVDEAIYLLGDAKAFRDNYAGFAIEVPEWLNDAISSLEKDVRARRRDELERRLKEAVARRASLRTAEEKRTATDEEIKRLEEALDKG